MKIKTKKQINLPQLIEWGFENDVTNTWYRASNVEEYISEVFFGATGLPQFSNTVDKNDLFTVEVEEEITEDTELNLIERFIVDNETYYTNPQELSINTCLEAATDDITPTHFYVENEDRELMLIWRDGKMVE